MAGAYSRHGGEEEERLHRDWIESRAPLSREGGTRHGRTIVLGGRGWRGGGTGGGKKVDENDRHLLLCVEGTSSDVRAEEESKRQSAAAGGVLGMSVSL